MHQAPPRVAQTQALLSVQARGARAFLSSCGDMVPLPSVSIDWKSSLRPRIWSYGRWLAMICVWRCRGMGRREGMEGL